MGRVDVCMRISPLRFTVVKIYWAKCIQIGARETVAFLKALGIAQETHLRDRAAPRLVCIVFSPVGRHVWS